MDFARPKTRWMCEVSIHPMEIIRGKKTLKSEKFRVSPPLRGLMQKGEEFSALRAACCRIKKFLNPPSRLTDTRRRKPNLKKLRFRLALIEILMEQKFGRRFSLNFAFVNGF